MKPYSISFARSAEKALAALHEPFRGKIIKAIQALAHDPHPVGSKKMVGTHATYRIRVQNYRVVYDVDHGQVTVLVLKIAHRRDVYR